MQVCGVCITDEVVDIIFHVFDANRDGSLSAAEFVRVVQRREVLVLVMLLSENQILSILH